MKVIMGTRQLDGHLTSQVTFGFVLVPSVLTAYQDGEISTPSPFLAYQKAYIFRWSRPLCRVTAPHTSVFGSPQNRPAGNSLHKRERSLETHHRGKLAADKHSAEKSRHLKVSDMCRATIETLPLTWVELTASQPLKMALGHTKFGNIKGQCGNCALRANCLPVLAVTSQQLEIKQKPR
ncbi:hypothetical protein JOQ06_027525, partial [Pogonophryne albipinna]